MSDVEESSASPPAPPAASFERLAGPSPTGRRVLLSLAVAAMGVVDVLSALLSHPPERLLALRRFVPTEVLDTSRTLTLLAGALLLVTAWGLRRGKRRAYVLALLLCSVSVPVNVLKALDLEEAIAATGLMFLLGVTADAFRVRSREFSLASLRSGAAGFGLALLLYVAAGELALQARYGTGTAWRPALEDAVSSLLGVGDPVTIAPPSLPPAEQRIVTWYHRSLPVLGLAFVLFVAVGSLRPARHRRRHRAEAERVRDLVRAWGEAGVSAFAPGDEMDYFFSRNGRAVIAYRFESDVLLALGDPIGPEEEFPSLLADFEAYCRGREWQFAFFQARPERLGLYRARGWRWLHVGEEPVLPAGGFTLEGGARGSARRSARKAAEAGLVARHFIPGEDAFDVSAPAEAGLLDELRSVSQEWLQDHPGGEMTLGMGRFDPRHLPATWVSVAWNPQRRRVEAFLTWEPVPARRGWALDLMRRRRDAVEGTMEWLVAGTVARAAERGDAFVSLSLSPLARVGPDEEAAAAAGGAGPARAIAIDAEAARAFLTRRLRRLYDFEGLFHWKKKFDPVFEDRYLVYAEGLALPQVILALVRAQSPGGLVASLRRLLPARPDRSA